MKKYEARNTTDEISETTSRKFQKIVHLNIFGKFPGNIYHLGCFRVIAA